MEKQQAEGNNNCTNAGRPNHNDKTPAQNLCLDNGQVREPMATTVGSTIWKALPNTSGPMSVDLYRCPSPQCCARRGGQQNSTS